jgi:hypothetical protein
MNNNISKNLISCLLLIFGILLSQTASSNLLRFTFSQGGFPEEATISGSFEGMDSNSDGRLIKTEISSFDLHFSGSSQIPKFDFDFNNNNSPTRNMLLGFAYTLDGGPLGDNKDILEVISIHKIGNVPVDEPIFGTPDIFQYTVAPILSGGEECGNNTGSPCAFVRLCSIGENCASLSSAIDPVLLSSQPVIVNAVPIPATIWLFGSAIVGLFGIRRSKNNQ